MFGFCKRADLDVDSSATLPQLRLNGHHSDPGTSSRTPKQQQQQQQKQQQQQQQKQQRWGGGLSWGNSNSTLAGPPKSTKPPRAPQGPNSSVKPLARKLMPLLTDEVGRSADEGVRLEAGTVHGEHEGAAGGPIRNYTGEELEALGFKTYSPNNITQTLPSCSSQPLVFLAVETEGDERMFVPVGNMALQHSSYASKMQNKIVPVYVNSSMKTYFGIASPKEYAPVLRKLLKRDPLLTFALQKALRFLKVAQQKSVNHVTPDPSGQTSSLFGLRVTPCVWEEDGRQQPSLLIEHNVPYNPAEVMPRLMRDYAVLSHVPAILTLIDFQGKVLYQNASSLAYMGDLLSVKYDSIISDGLLKILFTYNMDQLENLLEDVLGGSEWQGMVQVPYSLRKFLAANMYAHQDADDSFTLTGREQGVGGVRVPSGRGVGRRSSVVDDELELQFQIGNSFTTRGLVGSHMKGSSVAGKASGASFVSTKGGQPQSAALPGVVTQHGEQGSFTEALGSGSSESVPQNRIASLLGRAPVGKQAAHIQRNRSEGELWLERRSSEPSGGDMLGAASRQLPDAVEGFYDDEQISFHEIHAIPLLDPVLDKQVIMLVQTDVTPRVELENRLADLTEAQLSMLEHLFPRHVIEYMLARVPKGGARGMKELANEHDQVMVLFCDVVGFTSMSKEVEPSQVLHFLNELYEVFDNILDEYGLYKLDIVGDCYIAVAGLIKQDQDGFVCVDKVDQEEVTSNAVRIMEFAKAMLRMSKQVLMPHNSEAVNLRIGIHTGKLVSGLIGSKMPKFTLFGDTMNTASRMESTCRPGCVHVSDKFGELLPHEDWESTGGVEVKGKGLMQTRLWVPSAERSDLFDANPDVALRKLREQLTMSSFMSVKSTVTHNLEDLRSRNGSFHSSDDLDDDDDEYHGRSSNPLMAILQNIREDDSLGGSIGGGGNMGASHHLGGASSMRPKSAHYARAKGRTSTGVTALQGHDHDHPHLLSSSTRSRRGSEVNYHASSSKSQRESEVNSISHLQAQSLAAEHSALMMGGSLGGSRRSPHRTFAATGVRFKTGGGKHVQLAAYGSKDKDSFQIDEENSYAPLQTMERVPVQD